MRNFSDIAASFVASGAGVQVASETEFGEQLLALMTDPARAARLGAAALALVERNRGANDRTLDVLDALMPPRRISDEPFR
jgi:3-deoxy-D-manno-octulosonic-acid transferase